MSAALLVDLAGLFWANWHATADQPIGEAFERTIGGDVYKMEPHRFDFPVRVTYSIEQAEKANLVKPSSGWTKHPEAMLAKTAAVKLARRVYPKSVAGLYCPEELD